MQHTKKDITDLITRGDLKEAAEAALEYAVFCGSGQPANTLTVLNSRLGDHANKWTAGVLSYEESARTHAKIALDLTAVLEELPDHPAPNAGRKKLLDEATFKKRLFYGMIAAKVAVLLQLWHHSNFAGGTGSFSKSELFATMALLAPVFVAYLSAMLADYLRQHHQGIADIRRYVSGPLVGTAYWIIPLHALALMYVIEMKAATEITFAEMNTGLALVETLLGGYVGQIVFAFFKK
jgi:hypothetical protein